MIFLYFHELHHNVCPSAKMMAGQGWLWLIAVDHTSWSAWSVTTTSHLSHLLWTLSSSQSSSSPSSSSASLSRRESPIISSVCFVLIHIKDRSWRLLSEAITGCCISYAWSGLHILPAIMRHKEFSRFWRYFRPCSYPVLIPGVYKILPKASLFRPLIYDPSFAKKKCQMLPNSESSARESFSFLLFKQKIVYLNCDKNHHLKCTIEKANFGQFGLFCHELTKFLATNIRFG